MGSRFSKSSAYRLVPLFTPAQLFEVYYRVYTEEGAIPSKTLATSDDPFLGRIKATSVPPPPTVASLKSCIAAFEDINHSTQTSLFLNPTSKSPMNDVSKVKILSPTGPGFLAQEPLALVVKLSDSARADLESGERTDLLSTLEHGATDPNIRYRTSVPSIIFPLPLFVMSSTASKVYYRLYTEGRETPSKVSIDPEEPSLGRIRADSIAPPHTLTSIKRCISKVEGNPGLAFGHLFANISSDIPMKYGLISVLTGNIPGLSKNKPMALVRGVSDTGPYGQYTRRIRAIRPWSELSFLVRKSVNYSHCNKVVRVTQNGYH